MRNERGFTLAELLIVVAILGFMMGALFTLQRQGQLAYLIGSARVEVQQNARLALDMMTTQLRSAQGITTAAGCNAGCTSITFNDQNSNAVTYRLTGTDLECSTTAPAAVAVCSAAFSTVIGGVSALAITTYDGTNQPTATAADIRAVKISITTQTEKTVASNSPGNQHSQVEARVRLRNLL
ncbi:MAG TPA: type II secretion system protein [Vicinamibacterales bacterium]|jgi:prepilin-type N-terminal cleavage/methylation domain-containing protein|nr:type II secretion system protein [Vicinamibacterales bacterium]HEV8614036.1 type II secretion system protein [Methylomirabilota bacterium]